MFSTPLDLSVFKTEGDSFNYLYTFFTRDFITQKTLLAQKIYLDPAGQGMRNGREEIFWHITTRERKKRVKQGKTYTNIITRPLDLQRASRIEWIRPMLLNHQHSDIRLFYRKETKAKKPIRLYLWAYQQDFVVIVQKLGASNALLVTSFYITESYKRNSYTKWYADYTSGNNPDLKGCEWF